MNPIKSLIKIMYPDILKSFIIFWSIMAAILFAGYIIATLTETTTVYLLVWPFFIIWLSISSFQLVKSDFHYALKLGATRNQFLIASIMLITMALFIGEMIHLMYVNVIPYVAELVGLQSVTLFDWANAFPALSNGLVIGYDLILALFFSTICFTLASIRHHYGKLPVFLFLGTMGILLLMPTINEALVDWVMNLYHGKNLLSVFGVGFPAIIAILVSRQTLLKASLR